jgi:uncharacterized membrane protein
VDHRLHDGLRPLRNPLRSEAEGFRFLGVVVVGAIVIIGASKLNVYAGVAAAVLVVAGIVWYVRS